MSSESCSATSTAESRSWRGRRVQLRVDPEGHGIWFGDRHVPWAQVKAYDSPIGIPLGTHVPYSVRQARIPFENGLALSVIWGSGTYSDNHEHGIRETPFTETPRMVEVAALDQDNELIRLSDDELVAGYVDVGDLVDIVDFIGALPSGTTTIEMEELMAWQRRNL